MVRNKDNDPMFLSDAINAQTKDDEEKKASAETPSEEPKKSDVDLQQMFEADKKKSEGSSD